MSAKLTGAVWELDLERPEKYVLLALADHAKEDGSDVYPSLARIEWKTGYSETQVRGIMRDLRAKGILRLVRKGGKGPGDCDEYRIEVGSAASLMEFRQWLLAKKGAKTEPLANQAFPQRGSETAPISIDRMGSVEVEKGFTLTPQKGAETEPESKSNHKHITKPSAPDVADPRHQPFREIVISRHASANDMAPDIVTWDGREGRALNKVLNDKPKLTEEQFRRCVMNYYASDVNISRRPAEGVLKDPTAFWIGDTNEFDRPRMFTEKFQHNRKASIGRGGMA